ncbi:MAG TPA: protein kinase [Gemmatimonadaceae bacterium]|nr:protein kinase [Gemmatimonadaceae bacterium]
MECTHCHTPLPEQAKFCFACGSDLTVGGTPRPAADPMAELRDRLARTLEGRYAVQELLGAGGMAAVFLARDLTLDRDVAIKVLPLSFAGDAQVVQRFQREAKTAAKLDHPHIIPIYRVESEGGLEYFAMKYVPGRSLERVMADGAPAPLDFATRVLCEAAAALGHAHQRGVVHRDVKPANIMLDADDRVILTDFGISKAGDAAAHLTNTGVVVGTPFYMAPEQAMAKPVDGRADQYALGVVAYHLLTGRLLFDGDSAQAILVRHILDEPPRVSASRPDVPPHVDDAVARALAKEPTDRFETMEHFAAALRGVAPPKGAATTGARAAQPAPSSSAVTVVTGAATVPARAGVTTPMRPPPAPTRRRLMWLAPLGLLLAAGGAGAAVWMRPAVPEASAGPVPASTDPSTPPTSAPPAAPRGAPDRTEGAPTPPAPRAGGTASRVPRAEPRAEQRTAPLTVGSEPYGTLYVDDVEIGDTPVANHPLAVGRAHELRVEREGYRTKRETITVTGPNAIRRRYILEPKSPQ